MANTLVSLIKVSKKKVEDKQKEIAALLDVMAQMDAREAELKQKMTDEARMATESGDVLLMQAAGSYAKAAQDELLDIAEARVESEKILAKKREDLRLLFVDQKQYEILNERKLAEKKKEIQKKRQQELDDLSSVER